MTFPMSIVTSLLVILTVVVPKLLINIDCSQMSKIPLKKILIYINEQNEWSLLKGLKKKVKKYFTKNITIVL